MAARQELAASAKKKPKAEPVAVAVTAATNQQKESQKTLAGETTIKQSPTTAATTNNEKTSQAKDNISQLPFKVSVDELETEVKNNMINYDLPVRERRYATPSSPKMLSLMRRQIALDVAQIIKEEQPVNFSRIRSCISFVYNLPGNNMKLAEIIKLELKKAYADPSSLSDNPTYWENEASANGYDTFRCCKQREIEDIPIVEVKNAIRMALKEQISISATDLQKQIIMLMGRPRRTVKSDELVSCAIQQLEQEGFLKKQCESIVLIG